MPHADSGPNTSRNLVDDIERFVARSAARVVGAVAERWRPVVLNEGALEGSCDPNALIHDPHACVARMRTAHTQHDDVDYGAIAQDPVIAGHMARMRCLRHFDPRSLESQAAQRAFWINLYNLLEAAITFLRAVAGHGRAATVAR